MKFPRIILTTGLCFIVFSAQAAGRDPILERYIRLAVTQNPQIAVADRTAEAMQQEIPQVGTLPEPMLGFGIKDLSADDPALSRTEMTGQYVMLEQMFPFPGTLGLRQNIARHEYNIAKTDATNARLMLTAEIAELYYRWAYIREAAELVRQNKSLMKQMADLAATAYSVGMGAQSDILQARTQVTKFDIELADLKQKERSIIADINICCNLPPDATTTPPSPLVYEAIDVPYDSLWTRITNDNPEAVAGRIKRDAADAKIKLAKKMYYPDFSFGVEYMQRGKAMPENMISFNAGVSLPIYWSKKQDPMLKQRRIQRQAAAEAYQSTLNTLHFDLTDMTTMTASLREQIENYRDIIIPQAEQTFESAQAGYTNGKVDFMTVLASQMTLLDARRDFLMKTSEYLTTWAKIETMTARTLP